MKILTPLFNSLLNPVLISVSLSTTAVAAERPNIVFIFSDDHALGAISAYGGRLKELAPTPNIDRLAKEGAIFENSFCANSICGPSRASILTGKHSHINGFKHNGNSFNGKQWTFPKQLQTAGYQTAVVGKWHLHTLPTGFDYWEVLPGQGSYYNPDFRTMPDGEIKRTQGYCTDVVTDKSLAWLDKRDKKKPFMLMCQHKAPHRNWAAAPRHLNLYRDTVFPEPDTLFDNYKGRAAVLKKNEMTLARHFSWGHDCKLTGKNIFPKRFTNGTNGEYARMTGKQKLMWDKRYEIPNAKLLVQLDQGMSDKELTSWKYQRYMRDYLSTIRAVDESVARVLEYLEKNGLAENTIVIYSSDQGFYLGEHGWYDKRWMYEQSLKMPFLIRWPGVIKPGSRSKTMIQNIDYAPTFLELAGVKAPKEVQGKSLVPVFRKSGEKLAGWTDSIYYAYWENPGIHNVPRHDGVRTERYKIFYLPQTKEWQLYDLEKDPKEMNSVHDDADYAEVCTKMKERYTAKRKEYQSTHK